MFSGGKFQADRRCDSLQYKLKVGRTDRMTDRTTDRMTDRMTAFFFNVTKDTSSYLSTVVWSCYVTLWVEVWNISLLFDE